MKDTNKQGFIFNWGHGIFLFYVVFVGAVVTAVVSSFGVDHSLVMDDYYQKDLTYQQHMEMSRNALENKSYSFDYNRKLKQLEFTFGAAPESGEIHFYRPSESGQDFNVNIDVSNLVYPTNNLKRGRWLLKMQWQSSGKDFYKEEEVYI